MRPVVERHHVAAARRHHAGNRADPFERGLHETFSFVGGLEPAGHAYPDGEHVVGGIAGVDGRERDEAARQQHADNQQGHGETGLQHQEQVAKPSRARREHVAGRVAAPQPLRELDSAALQRRRQPGEHCREGDEEQRQADGPCIDPCVVHGWKLGSDHGSDNIEQHESDPDTQSAARRSQDHVLGQKLADEPRASRPQRGADSQLPGSLQVAPDKQIGHVGARGQEEERRSQHQYRQRRPHVRRALLRHRPDPNDRRSADAEQEIASQCGLRQPLCNRRPFRRRAGGRSARREPAQSEERGHSRIPVPRHRSRRFEQGPEKNLSVRKEEPRRSDTDDRAELPVDEQSRADDVVPSAERFAPERVAENDTALLFGCICRAEEASRRGPHAEKGEQVSRDGDAAYPDRLVRKLHRMLARFVSPEPGERLDAIVQPGLICEVAEQRVACRRRRSGTLLGDPYHRVWIRVRQRPDQHFVDDGVQRGRRADAEREHEDAERREGRRPAHQAQREANVLAHRCHFVAQHESTHCRTSIA